MLWVLVALLNPPVAPQGAPGSKAKRAVQAAQTVAAAPVIDFMTLTDDVRIKAAMGKRVRVVGLAQDCKLSVCIILDDAAPQALQPMYVLTTREWGEPGLNTRVQVVGVLSQTDRFKAFKADDGSVSQGTSGAVFHLKDAVIKPLN